MPEHTERTALRVQRLRETQARIEAKLAADPSRHNAEALRDRLGGIAEDIEILELEAKAKALRAKRSGDVTVGIPSGALKVEGQS